MRHEDLTQEDFERSPVWRLAGGWDKLEPEMDMDPAWLESPSNALLVAIEVTMPNRLTLLGYAVLGDVRDPSALFLWETPTQRIFLNGRSMPFDHVLQRLIQTTGAELKTLFPLTFRIPHLQPPFIGQFMPHGLLR